MTRAEHLVHCKQCALRKLDFKRGLLCSITNEFAAFEGSCSSFQKDEIGTPEHKVAIKGGKGVVQRVAIQDNKPVEAKPTPELAMKPVQKPVIQQSKHIEPTTPAAAAKPVAKKVKAPKVRKQRVNPIASINLVSNPLIAAVLIGVGLLWEIIGLAVSTFTVLPFFLMTGGIVLLMLGMRGSGDQAVSV